MAHRTDLFDLARLNLASGQGRRLTLDVELEPLQMSGQRYEARPAVTPVTLDVSRMSGGGYSLRLRLDTHLAGPCMRCLVPAAPELHVDAREIDQTGGGEELDSPYVSEQAVLDLRAWARDAIALALPAQVLCREDCAGLCPACGVDLNQHPDHRHEPEPDPRWAKLRELKLD